MLWEEMINEVLQSLWMNKSDTGKHCQFVENVMTIMAWSDESMEDEWCH